MTLNTQSVQASIQGEAVPRWQVLPDGTHVWSDGTVDSEIKPFTVDPATGIVTFNHGVVIPTGDLVTADLADDAVTNAKLAPSALKVYRFVYDFAVLGGAAGAITLTASDGQLPDNFVIMRATMHTKTAATSGGAATIAVGITGNTDGFIAATAYTDNKFDTVDQVTAFAGDQVGVITGAASDVIWTVADAALTAGKHEIWVEGFEAL